MYRTVTLITVILFLFSSCDPNSKNNDALGNDPADSSILSHSDDRDEWQKPYAVLELWKDILPGTKVMEIGSNDGYWTYKLAKAGAHVVAADFSEARLEALMEGARKKGLENMIETRLITLDDPMLQPAEMDYVWAINLFSTLPDRVAFFTKVHTGLKQKGQLVLIDWIGQQTPHGPPIMERISGVDAMDDMDQAGFADVSVRTKLMPEQWIMVAQNIPPEAYQ